eukprot:TRINITY_DN4884_c0_g1_i2.p3 TRINITY_DN4884_c0_g1~~TRINITY_DN4884_c0_g1_i2.p3  ORF type:complete len:272 (-),score=66.22 TRINITY_DN4884_c0_g1_i2:32-847(-)
MAPSNADPPATTAVRRLLRHHPRVRRGSAAGRELCDLGLGALPFLDDGGDASEPSWGRLLAPSPTPGGAPTAANAEQDAPNSAIDEGIEAVLHRVDDEEDAAGERSPVPSPRSVASAARGPPLALAAAAGFPSALAVRGAVPAGKAAPPGDAIAAIDAEEAALLAELGGLENRLGGLGGGGGGGGGAAGLRSARSAAGDGAPAEDGAASLPATAAASPAASPQRAPTSSARTPAPPSQPRGGSGNAPRGVGAGGRGQRPPPRPPRAPPAPS